MIVFLVRHFNDIDHMVPIIYRMRKDNAADLRAFCMDAHLEIRDDFWLNFFKNRFGCKTMYIFQAYTPSMRLWLFSFLVCQLRYVRFPVGLRWMSRIAKTLAYVAYNSTWRDRLYDKDWAEGFPGGTLAGSSSDWRPLGSAICCGT